MKLLVTAGNTLAMIDRVRCLTNIFSGRTGANIAQTAQSRGHSVVLLTSHPETVASIEVTDTWKCIPYRTFEDLEHELERQLHADVFDAIVHCAAVSDYLSAGVYAPADGTRFDVDSGKWYGTDPALQDRVRGKIRSDEPELWIRLIRAPKLIDRMRPEWGFRGVLVKFKLEVGLSDEQLLSVAEQSRIHSAADLMVANTLEGANQHAFLGNGETGYVHVNRTDLPDQLINRLEAMCQSSAS